jgi:hypothetical protein
VEGKRAAERAQLASQHVTPEEKLLVKWMISRKQGRFVDAIAAMNDLLAIYPHDTELNFEAGLWSWIQGEYEVSAKFLKRGAGQSCYGCQNVILCRNGTNRNFVTTAPRSKPLSRKPDVYRNCAKANNGCPDAPLSMTRLLFGWRRIRMIDGRRPATSRTS